MNIQENYLTINPYSRCGEKLTSIKKIVLHWVGNPGSSALGNRNYFESLKVGKIVGYDANGKPIYQYASAQYIVGLDGTILKCMPENEIAWHAGNLNMNYNSIGIEVCHPDWNGKYSDVTYNSLIELLKYLCAKYNLTSNDIIRHYDVTGKICPKYYVENPYEFEKIKSDVNIGTINPTPIQPQIVTPQISTNKFTVRVDKDIANVRTQPNSTAPLGGSQKLLRGYTFSAVGTVQGEYVNGNNIWYKSAVGNYVWSGGLTQISGNYKPQAQPIVNNSNFTIRVDKPKAMVRTQANQNAPLGGNGTLYKGDTFVSNGTVIGENVSGNNIWYRSLKGNYVWSGGLTKI